MMSVFVSENVLAENWGTKDYIQQYEKEMKALDGSMKNSFSSFSQDIMVTEGDRNKNSKSKEKVEVTPMSQTKNDSKRETFFINY